MKAQQAAAIPIRRSGSDVQVCLIRKRISTSWGIPKGTVDPGDTPATTALKEAWEEAGLRGALIGDPLGTYRYEKFGRSLVVMLYLMDVLEQYDAWQESGVRERRWTSLEEALELLSEHPAHPLIDRALQRFSIQA